jgi:hypothetical protein
MCDSVSENPSPIRTKVCFVLGSNLDYVCKENGRCVVDVTRRNQCQACRFNKCLQVNMKKDGKSKKKALQRRYSIAHT